MLDGEGEFVPVMNEGAPGPLLSVPSASYPNSTSNQNKNKFEMTYRCEMSNALGTLSVNFSISLPPTSKVSIEPARILARNGQTAEFACKVETGMSSPTPEQKQLHWFKNGKRISPSESSSGSGGLSPRLKISFGKLFIFNVRFGDQGVYQCFYGGEDQDGGASASATLVFPS